MTKTLTEQWRDKELKDGDYYVLNKAGDIVCDYYIEILGHFDGVLTENVKEVLAPVPSYEEYKQLVSKTRQLEKKLEIATKALEELESKSDKFDYSWSITEQLDFIKARCQEVLYQIKEMEGVK